MHNPKVSTGRDEDSQRADFSGFPARCNELADVGLKSSLWMLGRPIKDDYPDRCKHVYQEAVQVATMAIRVMEEGDRDYPAYVPHLGMSDKWPERD